MPNPVPSGMLKKYSAREFAGSLACGKFCSRCNVRNLCALRDLFMESLPASYTFLLIPVALLALLGLIAQKPLTNALLLLLQSSFIALYCWFNREHFGGMALLSLLLFIFCSLIWTATIYLNKTTQVHKPTRSLFSIILALFLFLMFALSFRQLKGGEVLSTQGYEDFFTANIFAIFVAFFIILSILIAAAALVSSKHND